jgi:hypothetical protein
MPDDRREKDKYPRASFRELAGGELRTLSRNPALIALLVALLGGWLFLTISRPEPVVVGELAVGDCLYIKAADAEPDPAIGRPIGSEGAVTTALFEGGTERAPCDASHSHEVADVWILDDPLTAPYPGQSALIAAHLDRCTAAFEAYVGHLLEGSEHALTIAVPTPAAWDDGKLTVACLVANRDGTYMLANARGSGR